MKGVRLCIVAGILVVWFMGGCAKILPQGLQEEGVDLIVGNSPEETWGKILAGLSRYGYQLEKQDGCGGAGFITAQKEVKSGDDFGTVTLNWGIFPLGEAKTRIHLTGAQNMQTRDGTLKVFWLLWIIPIPYGMSYQVIPADYGQLDAEFLHQMLDKMIPPTAAGHGKDKSPNVEHSL